MAVLRAAGPLPLSALAVAIRAVVSDERRAALSRAEALRALDRLGDPKLPEAVSRALADRQRTLRIEAQRLLARLEPKQALAVLSSVLENGSTAEKQAAFATLGTMKLEAVDDLLALWLGRQSKGTVAADVELDLLEAARQRKSDKLAAALRAIDTARTGDDPLSAYRETLVGGNAERGARIVAEKAEVQCIRCHKVKGQGGELGPELTGIGTRQDRRYLLESIVAPNRQIAKGFETLLISTTDGQVQSGILKEDSSKELRLITAEGKPLTIPKAEIEDQKRGASAMPEDLIKHLSKAEIRDLIEYLATLK
jgi:quinoprotein glucose dehydrogenase